ncbi:MAG: DinB family protein [Candidatus Acidiferrales bacterium]
MPLKQFLIEEFDREMTNTRKTLERVPAEKWDWKPHNKSGTLGWLAGHIATLPGFGTAILRTPSLNIAGAKFPRVESHAMLIDTFDRAAEDTRKALSELKDEQLDQNWTLTNNGQTIFALPRYHALRNMCFNHVIHHRAQLTVYLRLLDVAVPALYGPSADEATF